MPANNAEMLISVCVVLRNARGQVIPFLEALTALLSIHFRYYEILLIDNNSADDTPTLIQQAQGRIAGVRLLRLSRIYSLETALAAALDHAIGDNVILLDGLESPLEVIPSLVAKAQEGYDVVSVRQPATHYSALDRAAAKLFLRIANRILGAEFHLENTNYQLFSRAVVNALTQIRRKRRSLRYFSDLVGVRRSFVALKGAPNNKIPVRRLTAVRSALDLIISNSSTPLRAASVIGLVASALSLLYVVYILIVTVVKQNIVEGWLSTSAVMTTMFFLLSIMLTILAEYVGRILEEVRDEPLYFIEYEKSGLVSSYARDIAEQKVNVV